MGVGIFHNNSENAYISVFLKDYFMKKLLKSRKLTQLVSLSKNLLPVIEKPVTNRKTCYRLSKNLLPPIPPCFRAFYWDLGCFKDIVVEKAVTSYRKTCYRVFSVFYDFVEKPVTCIWSECANLNGFR